MPSPKRKLLARREKFVELTDEIKRTLLNGTCYWDEPSIDLLRDAWKQYGEEILEQWIIERPCSRPFGAWLFDIVPEHGERLQTEALDRYGSREALLKYGILHTHCVPSFQEPEAVFLERHGLLTSEEVIMLIDDPELRELKTLPARGSKADA
jgi:hypothetical protein